MSAAKRTYIVMCGRGRIAVTVLQYYIDKYGERETIATAAWNALMKDQPTRDILTEELGSRYEAHRWHVYETFKTRISYQWTGVVHG